MQCKAVLSGCNLSVPEPTVAPKTRLFMFKAGTLVNPAMDLEEVHMTPNSQVTLHSSFLLIYGNGEGVIAGAGNSSFEDKYSVSYVGRYPYKGYDF